MSRSYGTKEARRISDRAAEKHNKQQGFRHLECAKVQLQSAQSCFMGAKDERHLNLTSQILHVVEEVCSEA